MSRIPASGGQLMTSRVMTSAVGVESEAPSARARLTSHTVRTPTISPPAVTTASIALPGATRLAVASYKEQAESAVGNDSISSADPPARVPSRRCAGC